MSTRSMTMVAQPYSGDGKYIALYRHCDGYPSVAGAAIAEVLSRVSLNCEGICVALLTLPDAEYRLATWMPSEQGDLEHIYTLQWNGRNAGSADYSGAWSIKHEKRIAWNDTPADWESKSYTLAEWVKFVERERKAMEARIAAYHAKRGDAK